MHNAYNADTPSPPQVTDITFNNIDKFRNDKGGNALWANRCKYVIYSIIVLIK